MPYNWKIYICRCPRCEKTYNRRIENWQGYELPRLNCPRCMETIRDEPSMEQVYGSRRIDDLCKFNWEIA